MHNSGSNPLHPPWQLFLSHIQVVHRLHYIHLANKKHRSCSNNVIHSATAHTRPSLQTERCGAASFTQTPYISHHLARVLSGSQLHCCACLHELYTIYPLLLHRQSDMQYSATYSSVLSQGSSCLQAQTDWPHIHIWVSQLECPSFAACTSAPLNIHSIASLQ